MPAAHLHYHSVSDHASQPSNTLPNLLQTPLGIALIEVQGTIHFPVATSSPTKFTTSTEVGRLEFPLYNPSTDVVQQGRDREGIWMKKVYLYVGKYQRLVGEVKKLPKPLIVIAKDDGEVHKGARSQDAAMVDNEEEPEQTTMLNVMDIIRYKIIFSGRPEPVGES